MRFRRDGSVMSVDLHGLYRDDAENLLLNWLDHVPPGVTELRVVHGANRGTVLQELVRYELHHRRISAVLPALNPGETRILIR